MTFKETSVLYIADLHLAAELGKALLETNRELETQAMHLQQVKHEQSLEIEVKNIDHPFKMSLKVQWPLIQNSELIQTLQGHSNSSILLKFSFHL